MTQGFRMNIIVTGSSGFIGGAFCNRLSPCNNVIGVDYNKNSPAIQNFISKQADLTNLNRVDAICEKYSPDVVIHCAGIAHQKIGAVDLATYMCVNSEATENLAKSASRSNPSVRFIFLSSVSVYGEENLTIPVSEESSCKPSSNYAISKLDAERRLISLFDERTLHSLVILRLAPAYDRDWSFNLDRRVFAPIIQVFKKSGIRPNRPVLSVPLSPVWIATRIAGALFPNKRNWLHSCYDKLASDLVFSNEKMLGTGFKPHHSLETVFAH